ncbi:MAG: extracellular solute-binding protein [Christensenellales bacterium]|jgi:iron(III) transport system substrate-binding protein|nr:extracellular solute-binding protein [Clostridiales bacterium]
MKKILVFALAFALLLSVVGGTLAQNKDYSGYTIRIYSNSNSTERTTWLKNAAKAAGFTISIDDTTVVTGDVGAIQAANENKDGDILFGLNETRWSQVVDGTYENLKLVDWTPSWADEVGEYAYPGKAYGLVIQNILMLYRTDELGTNGKELKFKHWADLVDTDYTWYRQGRVGGTTNSNINNSLLYAFVDPASPAGGISIDGWKMLWKYCENGVFTGDSYGFDPLNRGDVQVGTFYSSSLYGKIDAAADSSKNPLLGTMKPENWALVDIEDGTYYIAEYLGILDRPGRTAEQTEAVTAFAEWFGSAEVQANWGEEFDSYPCNEKAVAMLYPDGKPPIYKLKNFALQKIEGTDMIYAEYVAEHASEWTNIMTNLGFFWADAASAVKEPDWDTLDWATLTQSK